MRIVGYIEHSKYKITIMHMNHRFALKFENDGIEQTYKVRASDSIKGAEDIKLKVDDAFLSEVDKHFINMEKTRCKLLTASDDEEEFEEII